MKYWRSVGARASDKVTVFLNKFLAKFEAEAGERRPAEAAKQS